MSERGIGAALMLPACSREAMQLHLDEIQTTALEHAHQSALEEIHRAHRGVLNVRISISPLRQSCFNSTEFSGSGRYT